MRIKINNKNFVGEVPEEIWKNIQYMQNTPESSLWGEKIYQFNLDQGFGNYIRCHATYIEKHNEYLRWSLIKDPNTIIKELL